MQAQMFPVSLPLPSLSQPSTPFSLTALCLPSSTRLPYLPRLIYSETHFLSMSFQPLSQFRLCDHDCSAIQPVILKTIHLKATTSLAAPDNSCRATAKNNIIITCLRNLKC